MKNKKVIISILVVVILLVSGMVLANFDEEGNFNNPFVNVLNKKVEEGVITQAEADTFTKVLNIVHEDPEFSMREKVEMIRNKKMLAKREEMENMKEGFEGKGRFKKTLKTEEDE